MRACAALLGLVLVACQPSTPQGDVQQQSDVESARAAITELEARWVRYVNQNQPDSIVTLFAPGGVMMPPDVPAATGADSITASNRRLIIPGGTLTITSENLSVSGPVAVNRGVWTYTVPAQGSTPALNLRGKYLEHLRNVDGRWLIAETIWNSDVPAPQPPSPPRRGS